MLAVTVTEVGTQSIEKLLLEVVTCLKVGQVALSDMGAVGTVAVP
jgi:hypothetical protein